MGATEIIEIIWTVALAIVAVVAGAPILFILFVFVLAVVILFGSRAVCWYLPFV